MVVKSSPWLDGLSQDATVAGEHTLRYPIGRYSRVFSRASLGKLVAELQAVLEVSDRVGITISIRAFAEIVQTCLRDPKYALLYILEP